MLPSSQGLELGNREFFLPWRKPKSPMSGTGSLRIF